MKGECFHDPQDIRIREFSQSGSRHRSRALPSVHNVKIIESVPREDPGDIYRAISFRYRLESTFSWRWWTTAPNFSLERSPDFKMCRLDAGLVHRQARTAWRYFASLTPEAISNEIGVTTPPPSLPLLQALRHLQTANRLNTRWCLVVVPPLLAYRKTFHPC